MDSFSVRRRCMAGNEGQNQRDALISDLCEQPNSENTLYKCISEFQGLSLLSVFECHIRYSH